jgi:hypothetical protein
VRSSGGEVSLSMLCLRLGAESAHGEFGGGAGVRGIGLGWTASRPALPARLLPHRLDHTQLAIRLYVD